ncbi:MFS general substrate transporter [Hesseltinella vesiculosa]|uniref:MFS general substrate transporter n=1 Tax=Hesseltinella vesiculosa TaxID=101127 RepID=A0A1X2GJL0_9FUNG|nr:MFS general substrate transporter [Hesseltinella vesiculosa]
MLDLEMKKPQFDSDKSSDEFDSQADIYHEPKATGFRFVLVFIGLILGFFMAALDQTIVITALGHISSEFQATNDIGWVGSSYLLTMSGFQPMYGIFADIIGHKFIYLVSIVIFLIGSVLCGMSKSMFMLIMSRAVQGIGGAGLITIVLIIVTDVVSPRDRAKYQGLLGVALGTATVAGPLIGGMFADANLWRWSFYMNLFIGAVAIVIIVFFFRQDMYVAHRESNLPLWTQLRQVDYASLVFLMPGAICLLVALQTGGEQLTWNTPVILALFGVGAAAMIMFVVSEVWIVKNNPVMPRRMVLQRSSMAIFVAQFAGGATDYAMMYFVPLQFQIVRGDTAVQSALELLSLFGPAVIAGLISGILISMTGHYRIFLWTGCALTVVGPSLMAISTIDTSPILQYVYLAILGLGIGLCKQSFVVAGQACVEDKDLSLATSHGQFFRIFGGAVGISASATLFRFNMATGVRAIMEKYHLKVTVHSIDMIHMLPNTIRTQVQLTAVQSLDKIYLFAAISSGIAFIAVLFVKHTDLWKPEDEHRHRPALAH